MTAAAGAPVEAGGAGSVTSSAATSPAGPGERARFVRRALAIGAAAGLFGLSFGALATAAGFGVAQACALSLLLYGGASQFALVAVAAAGGAPLAAVLTAVLLGVRNGLYGLRLAPVLQLRGWRRAVGAHLVSDESVALALSAESPTTVRLAFWSAGLATFTGWNLGTLVGALGANLADDPGRFGLDAGVSGAFLALMAPRLREPGAPAAVAVAVLVSVVTIPLLPAGFPVLVAAAAVFAVTRRPVGATREA